MKCTLTISRENSKAYWRKLVKFELKIMKETPEDTENGTKLNQELLFLANECSNHAKITTSGLL